MENKVLFISLLAIAILISGCVEKYGPLTETNKTIEENKTVQLVKVIDLLNNPELYDKSIVTIEGNVSNLRVFTSPPWLTCYLDDETGKIFVKGPDHVVMTKFPVNKTQIVHSALSTHLVQIEGRFYADAPVETNITGPIIIARKVNIKVNEEYELAWLGFIPPEWV